MPYFEILPREQKGIFMEEGSKNAVQSAKRTNW
jgi:hypothetical protein